MSEGRILAVKIDGKLFDKGGYPKIKKVNCKLKCNTCLCDL